MTKLVIKEELYDDVILDILPLLHEHWVDIAEFKEDFTLNPDFNLYQQLNQAGHLRIITARKEGVLVGYMIVMVTPHIHYKHKIIAKTDVLFLTKTHRS